ncbi:hypothetical protein Q9R19_02485 [Microbacterium sp. ARD32]|uniref:hypothetical protein n=1 Tax=Microbacterium sp. ARD32 TaxID=2962577 RepID=UPI002880D0AF|nr:hypothetical protein [Microbacterium sp. ARD32]MDT0156486.1 hypothetical protein [Microbacterium sp. ARD32]
MDPIWAAAAELWWVAPTVAGAGAVGLATVRRRQTVNGKRLGYDAARFELRQAQQEAREAAVTARLARTESARVAAERAASNADATAVASARRRLRDAQSASRAAAARVRAARARLSAERAAISSSAGLPLDRLRSRHDAVLARWMSYETDPGLALTYPAISDARQPHTAAFLTAVERARDLRPASESARTTASDFSAYRRAVDELERAFDIAERSARGERVQADLPDALWDAARGFAERSTEVISRTTVRISEWSARRRRER